MRKLGETSLIKLESELSNMLQPVKPDNDFVNTLKGKLTRVPSIIVESTKKNSTLLIIGLGVVVGIAAVWLLGRSKDDDSEE